MADNNGPVPHVNVGNLTVEVDLPEDNTIINNNCTVDNMTTISSVTSVGTDVHHVHTETSTSPLSHPCYAVLNGGRRNQLRNMSYRIELVASFLRLNTSEYLPPIVCDDIIIKSWYLKYKAYMKFPRKWNRAIMAQALCEFDLFLHNVRRSTAMDKVPVPISDFDTYMEDVKVVSEIAENEPLISKKGQIGKQPAGRSIQDSIDMSTITRGKLDFTSCANCKHNFVLPIGSPQIEINHHNDTIKQVYREKMYEYNHKSRSRKGGPKPKMGRALSMKLACLCTRMHCMNRPDGVGCLKCEWACFENKDKTVRPYFDENKDCTCPICRCQCSVVYFRNEEKKLAAQAKFEILESLDTKSQTRIDGFHGFTNAIADLAKKRIKDDATISSSTLLGLTSEDILHSIELQQDVDLRNTLQKSVGAISEYELKDGDGVHKSLAQLRTEARLKRISSPHKTKSHLPLKSDKDSASVVTPNKCCGPNLNHRWYRNKLTDEPIATEDDANSEASCVSVQSQNMRKLVMKRLLDITISPTSVKKRKCFKKMVENDEHAKTIIDLSIEMGSSMEETKNMLLNNIADQD